MADRSAGTTIGSNSTPGGTSTSSPTAASGGPPRPAASSPPSPPATPFDPAQDGLALPEQAQPWAGVGGADAGVTLKCRLGTAVPGVVASSALNRRGRGQGVIRCTAARRRGTGGGPGIGGTGRPRCCWRASGGL